MNKEIKKKILLVEDDPNLRAVLQDYLNMMNYRTIVAKDGDEGLDLFLEGRVDLCILDVMMPRKDGFTLAREIRAINEVVPIIFLTAKGLKEDRISGFQAGCDDYITKPFNSEELSLRIEAILKRCAYGMGQEDTHYQLGKYVFDVSNLILKSPNMEKTLTRKEAALLKLLCQHKNRLLTREKALKLIWGEDDYFIGRSMDVFITKLRKYLKDDTRVNIANVHGTGFKLEVKE